MGEPEPWRRTGRKAKNDHWMGLEAGVLVELSVYDDNGAQQGRAVAHLTGRGDEGHIKEGQVWLSRLVAIEDPYFDWWHDKTFGGGSVPLHVCGRQAQRCTEETLYRNALHMDVFRILPGRSSLGLSWPSDEEKARLEKIVDSRPIGTTPAGPPAGGEPGEVGEQVATGAEGIQGLAEALGREAPDREAVKKDKEEAKRRRLEKSLPAEPKEAVDPKDLEGVIKSRVATAPELSALKMKVQKKKKKKSDKKDKKGKKDKKKSGSGDSSSSSDSTSSSEDSVFRLAALPQGVEKLQRLHQERPGALANLTLRRFNELLLQSTGRGAASEALQLPAVARAYLSQIYLLRCPEAAIGLRNLRELRTLTTMVDLICSNDSLRALDIALQRVKAIEVFIS